MLQVKDRQANFLREMTVRKHTIYPSKFYMVESLSVFLINVLALKG